MTIDKNTVKLAFNKFLEPIRKTVFETLNQGALSDIGVEVTDVSELSDSLKIATEGRPLYFNEYLKEDKKFEYLLSFSNLLIKKIADIYIGGNGDIDPEESLTELETNALISIIKQLDNGITEKYNSIASTPIDILDNRIIIKKEDKNYEEIIDKCKNLDYIITIKVRLKSEEQMLVKWLVSKATLEGIIPNLHVENKILRSTTSEPNSKLDISTIQDIDLDFQVELGTCQLPIKIALGLTKGSLIPLDNNVGECMKIFVNGVEIGEGESVLVGDNFGIRIKKLYSKKISEVLGNDL